MTDPPTTPTTTAPEFIQSPPFTTCFEGHTSGPDEWPNTVTVSACETYNPAPATEPADDTDADTARRWADFDGGQQLVEIDTNYKPTRAGQHPVRLTRTDTARFAAAVLTAIEDTFHYSRVGQLRPAEAAQLLTTLDEVEHALTNLRNHALADLLRTTDLEPDAP